MPIALMPAPAAVRTPSLLIVMSPESTHMATTNLPCSVATESPSTKPFSDLAFTALAADLNRVSTRQNDHGPLASRMEPQPGGQPTCLVYLSDSARLSLA